MCKLCVRIAAGFWRCEGYVFVGYVCEKIVENREVKE